MADTSPTDTLIAAMEEAGTAKECLVIMTQENGQILTLSTSRQRVVRLGMIETAKQWIIAEMYAECLKEDS